MITEKYSEESYTPKRKTNAFMGSQGRTNHTRRVNKKGRIFFKKVPNTTKTIK